ncbi:hypothetical protein C2S52_001830 [Perilla frutescens var. hirtella]|nr:hypothetical protein C2S52_001830 [Perilla frutescens var. hirtella]
MDQIQIHPSLSTSFDNYQNQSLHEKLHFLLDFVENHSASVIHEKADFHLDSVTNYSDADRTEAEDLKVLEEMDSIKEKIIKVKEGTGFINHSTPPPSSSPPLAAAASKTTAMVGFDGYVDQLLDQLTGHDSRRLILPIVGMGGIGKTTLATNVYQNSNIMRQFNVRIWVTVSQEFSPRKIYLQALSCLGRSTSDTETSNDQQLSQKLYTLLYNRRYLVVLDDVWSIEAWDKIKFFFPENNNKSRIVVTTRESKLVGYFGSSALSVDFLNEKNSWELFCVKTFAQEVCPPELEQVGKKIVDKCRGLPLAIIVIGGLLGKSPRSQEYWEKIANEKNLTFDSGEGNESLSMLYLSYKHLPIWLKSCFLYLGLCSAYYVDVSELIKLWVAEGFMKPKINQSLEEVAESYVEDLVARNLLLLRFSRRNRKLGSCGVHDLVRDMCVRVAEKENVFCVQRDRDGKRHVIVDENRTWFYPKDMLSIDRPIRSRHGRRGAAATAAQPLRVMVRDMRRLDYSFPEVNVRLLYHEPDEDDEYKDFDPRDYWMASYELPSSISLLWSLQTLIVQEISDVEAPSEIWKMTQLRHIKMSSICVPDPPTNDVDVVVLRNLQTFKTVENLIFSEDVCKRIPNVKELGICYYLNGNGEASSRYHMHDVGRLNKLESLEYSCNGWENLGDDHLLWKLKLPSSLKELSLHNCKLEWSDMMMIGLLPHLELLLLRKIVVGEEWDFGEGEFLSLKHLRIDGCDDLTYFIAESSNFPVLETFSLESLPKMEEIPLGIGEIPTLERMEVCGCNESTTISAVEILQEQERFDNQRLQLKLKFRDETEAEMWRGKIQELGITCQNLIINW